MIEVSFSSSFARAFRKRTRRDAALEQRFWERLEWFIADPFDSRLRTHKLSGQLEALWSFSIDYDLRVVFFFEAEARAVLVDLGSHDEVY